MLQRSPLHATFVTYMRQLLSSALPLGDDEALPHSQLPERALFLLRMAKGEVGLLSPLTLPEAADPFAQRLHTEQLAAQSLELEQAWHQLHPAASHTPWTLRSWNELVALLHRVCLLSFITQTGCVHSLPGFERLEEQSAAQWVLQLFPMMGVSRIEGDLLQHELCELLEQAHQLDVRRREVMLDEERMRRVLRNFWWLSLAFFTQLSRTHRYEVGHLGMFVSSLCHQAVFGETVLMPMAPPSSTPVRYPLTARVEHVERCARFFAERLLPEVFLPLELFHLESRRKGDFVTRVDCALAPLLLNENRSSMLVH